MDENVHVRKRAPSIQSRIEILSNSIRLPLSLNSVNRKLPLNAVFFFY